MKEIDLLPEWYKSSRRRQIGYWAQYVVLGVVLAIIMVCSLIEVGAISKTKKEIAAMQQKATRSEKISQEFNSLKSQIERLEQKANVIRKVNSRIDVTSVLAELSFILDEKVVLSEVSFGSEKFPNAGKTKRGSVSRAAGKSANSKFVGDVRFKIVLNGVATDASNVAELICKLEESPYFSQVIPSFSRNKNIKAVTKLAGKNYQVSEFEISCYLANYKYESGDFAKNVRSGLN